MVMTRFLTLALLALLTACAGTPAKDAKTAAANPKATKEINLAAAEKAYKADSDDAAKALDYATALRMAGREAQAKVVLQDFADKPGASASVLNESARIALSEGQYKRALATAKNATQLYPDNGDAWNVLGLSYDALDKLKDAEPAYRKALELNPKDKASVYNNLALNLTLQEKLDQALPMIEEALKVAPDRRELKRNRAMIRAMHTQMYHTVE